MKHLGLVSLLVLVCLAPVCADDAYGKGWISLFDGKTLAGWTQINGTATYEVVEGTIVGTTAEGSPNSFLCTEKNYSDFILEFEVKVDDSLNSGVQIRSQSLPDYQEGRVHGYQVEIAAGGGSGFIYDEARRGWLTNHRENPDAKSAFKPGEWNQYRIVCLGKSIMTWVNGIPVAHIEDEMTLTGFIGLQVHSYSGEKPAQVAWRKIRIKELSE
ncbi:MAG: DUF1080 domain-containing protein [bacterium]|jgi:hypothetical protein|nr:DUF1080 domain-containing protein [bacterium]